MAASMTADSVKLDGGLAFLRLSGKGGKERVELFSRIMKEFKREPGGPLFVAKSGGPFLRQYVSREIARASRRVLGRTVTAHQLRHSRATDLYNATHKVRAIGGLLCHASESTTLRFYLRDDLTDAELFGPVTPQA
jgi:integrase